MPVPENIAALFEKLRLSQCSPAELETIVAWLAAHENEADASELFLQNLQQPAEEADISEAQRLRLEAGLRKILTPVAPMPSRYGWWAAAAALFIGILAAWLWRQPVTKRVAEKPAQTTSYVRTLTLPDSSTVVLSAGSRLVYPDHFSGDNREVQLTGKAYFDVTSDRDHPFIIYTGKVKTTVLGTAFNISAYPGQNQVIVAVTHGKVRVENEHKVLAELSPDEQLTYSLADASVKYEQVQATKVVTDWTKQDMAFENITFEATVKTLEKRYGAHIHFANPAIGNCLVFSSFDGTETLEKVLKGLARVQNFTYTIKDNNEIVIDGIGCQ